LSSKKLGSVEISWRQSSPSINGLPNNTSHHWPSKINQPVIEASLIINGTDVTVKNGQVGRDVDIQANITTSRRAIKRIAKYYSAA
jgi:hypothetical protein